MLSFAKSFAKNLVKCAALLAEELTQLSDSLSIASNLLREGAQLPVEFRDFRDRSFGNSVLHD